MTSINVISPAYQQLLCSDLRPPSHHFILVQFGDLTHFYIDRFQIIILRHQYISVNPQMFIYTSIYNQEDFFFCNIHTTYLK